MKRITATRYSNFKRDFRYDSDDPDSLRAGPAFHKAFIESGILKPKTEGERRAAEDLKRTRTTQTADHIIKLVFVENFLCVCTHCQKLVKEAHNKYGVADLRRQEIVS